MIINAEIPLVPGACPVSKSTVWPYSGRHDTAAHGAASVTAGNAPPRPRPANHRATAGAWLSSLVVLKKAVANNGSAKVVGSGGGGSAAAPGTERAGAADPFERTGFIIETHPQDWSLNASITITLKSQL